MSEGKYIDVILPLPLESAYTYSLPDEWKGRVEAGFRVIVPLGTKMLTGIVTAVHDNMPEDVKVRDIIECIDDHPVLLDSQMKLWKWMSQYYLCTQGEVMRAALPTGLKLESETQIEVNEDFEYPEPLKAKEQQVLDLLSVKSPMTIQELSRKMGQKSLMPLLSSLMEKDALWVRQEIRQTYRRKMEKYVRLLHETEILSSPDWETALNARTDLLNRARRQQDVFLAYLRMSGISDYDGSAEFEPYPVSRKSLMEETGCTAAMVNAIEDKGLFQIYERQVGRIIGDDVTPEPIKPLTPIQAQAYRRIANGFSRTPIALLHGVTSSGKTEIYIHLIEEAIKQGKQVLYLVPEIALTTQLTTRLKKVFGSQVGVYHSKYPDSCRVEVYEKQLSDDPYPIILGVRSSIFLPYRNLGLIIVDEEHENSYKQQDPAPRYHARNLALVLASQSGAKTLLGSATPSLESYYNAFLKKYAYIPLTERYEGLELPDVTVVDIKDARRRKYMNGPFSQTLLDAISNALERKEQVILFQNRRGFAPVVECRSCGWVPHCRYCDISLTYHKRMALLTCHYCGTTYQMPVKCPQCGEESIVQRGYGTERIEDLISEIFPQARVGRMDADTTRTRSSFERIIDDFQEGGLDILVGTQMVTKGLDFDRVSVVGILDADQMLNYPDFRSYERAYQMMAQVSGRAGRHGHRGRVILQTFNAERPIIGEVVDNDYGRFFSEQMKEREDFHYPPFYRLFYAYLKHRTEYVLEEEASRVASELRRYLPSRILGPDKPSVGRVQTMFIRKIVIKVETQASMSNVREILRKVQKETLERQPSLIFYYDVDPQ